MPRATPSPHFPPLSHLSRVSKRLTQDPNVWGALFFLGLCVAVQMSFAGWGLYRKHTTRLLSSALWESSRHVADAIIPNRASSASSITEESVSLFLQPRFDALNIRPTWQELLEKSRSAWASRQTETALQALLEAEANLPKQPAAMAELAIQYEKMGIPLQAIRIWEDVRKFGGDAGIFFDAADTKLSLLKEHAEHGTDPHPHAAPLSQPVPKPGFLRFGTVSFQNAEDSQAASRHFTVKIPVIRGENAFIESQNVFLQIQFYEQVQGKSLDRADANVRWTWSKNPIDWTQGKTQTLKVEYTQNPPRPGLPARRFYGYVASVYYNGKLLDTRANPARLGQQYPPPRMISHKETAP